MDIYKIKSLILILIIYVISLLPSIILFSKESFSDGKKSFIRTLSICTIIEVITFSIIYAFPRNIICIFQVPKNIENYSFYALKILFIASILTPIHYGAPIYLFKNKKEKSHNTFFFKNYIYSYFNFYKFCIFY